MPTYVISLVMANYSFHLIWIVKILSLYAIFDSFNWKFQGNLRRHLIIHEASASKKTKALRKRKSRAFREESDEEEEDDVVEEDDEEEEGDEEENEDDSTQTIPESVTIVEQETEDEQQVHISILLEIVQICNFCICINVCLPLLNPELFHEFVELKFEADANQYKFYIKHLFYFNQTVAA